MTSLAKLYLFKITATLVFWCVPLLLFPPAFFAKLGIILPTTLGVRLLGWAYLTFCVGYALGFADELKGERNRTVLWLGITSNGGAAFLLLYFAMFDALFQNSLFAQVYLLLSGCAALLITLGLGRTALAADNS